MKKTVCILLSLLLLLPLFAACGESKTNTETEKTTDTAASPDPTAQAPETEEADDGPHYYDTVPDADYDGWTMNIANDGLSINYYSGFLVEDLTGDAFNDAQYNRQVAVQERYDVKLVENNNGAESGLRGSVTAGSGDVAFGYVIGRSCMGVILSGIILPISTLPVIRMENPYWDQGAQKTLTFFGKMFYGYCDISWDHYESMAVLFYNGHLLTANGIQDTPYTLTLEGKWTLDRMREMCEVVKRDADGDGKMNRAQDIFGWSGRDFEYLPSLYSSNERLIRYDDTTGEFSVDITDEGTMAIGEKIAQLINDRDLSVNDADTGRNIFKAGRSLFYSRLLGDFRNLRDKEDDYGIVAYPSLLENTDGMVYVQNPYAILVPIDCPDAERLGTLLEALASYTHENVLDDYINKTVIGKGVRDRESAELLRRYLTVRAFDLCYAFGMTGPISAYMGGAQTGNFGSMQKRIEKQFAASMKKIEKALMGDD